MGWTVPYHTHSRDQLVEWLLHEQSNPGHCEIIDYARRGNVLYTVFHHRPAQYRFIVVFLLQGPTPASRRGGDHAWGYKDMDEAMGPYYYDCPERLLRQSDVDDANAVEWREACRVHRRERAQLCQLSKACRPGGRLQLKTGWRREGQITATVIFVRTHTATYFVGKDLAGKLWRYRWTNVVVDSASLATASDIA